MNIFEIEKLFESETTLDLVLEETSEIFEIISKYSKEAYQHQLDNPAIIDKSLDVLQGCYGILEPILALAETQVTNNEERFYCQLKIDTENEGKKFTDASAKREAKAHVADYIRVYNIILGHVKVCEKFISVAQSRLKRADDDSRKNKEG